MTDQRQIPKSKSWPEYRAAFDRFSIQVRHLQALTAEETTDPSDLEAAMIAVELARQNYNSSRDALAREMLQRSTGSSSRSGRDLPGFARARVKAMAELFWDLTGRLDGTAEENWYRAESIIRGAHSRSVCC
jgi:hypothetical protein